VTEGDRRLALLLREETHGPRGVGVVAEVACPDAGRAAGILAQLRELALRHNVFRGQVLSSVDGDYLAEALYARNGL